jgi:hypothetical protein
LLQQFLISIFGRLLQVVLVLVPLSEPVEAQVLESHLLHVLFAFEAVLDFFDGGDDFEALEGELAS